MAQGITSGHRPSGRSENRSENRSGNSDRTYQDLMRVISQMDQAIEHLETSMTEQAEQARKAAAKAAQTNEAHQSSQKSSEEKAQLAEMAASTVELEKQLIRVRTENSSLKQKQADVSDRMDQTINRLKLLVS